MRNKIPIILFTVLVLIYLGLSFLVTPNKLVLAQYHLTESGYYAIIASFVIPLVIIWTISIFSSLKMKSYVNLIHQSEEAQSLNTIAIGLIALVMAQVVNALAASLVNLTISHNLSWRPGLTIVNNYFAIVTVGVAFVVLAMGAWRLLQLLRKNLTSHEINALMFVFIILSAVYSYITVTQPLRDGFGQRQYYMPNWAVLATIAIPYLVIWYFGLISAYCIYKYQRNVKGVLYKNSLVYIASGVALIVLSSIAARFLATISPNLSRLHLTPLLFIVYGFLALVGIGFALVAFGSHKLQKIEKV